MHISFTGGASEFNSVLTYFVWALTGNWKEFKPDPMARRWVGASLTNRINTIEMGERWVRFFGRRL